MSATAERPGIGLRTLPSSRGGAVAPATPADLRLLADAALGSKGAGDLIALLAPNAAPIRETALGAAGQTPLP